MTTPRPRRALPRALPAAAAAALLVAAACELPRPTGPKAEARAPLTRLTEPTAAPGTADVDQEAAIAQMRRVIAEAYPSALQESSGLTQRYWFVQEASGRVSRVLRGMSPADAAPNARMANATMMVERDGRYVATAISPADADGAAGVPADRIASVNVMKLGAGRIGPDAMQAIWVRLRGADDRRTVTALTGTRLRATLRNGSDTVTVQQLGANGQAVGAPSMMRLRPSLRTTRDSAAAQPLYLVDGVEVTGGTEALPKPERIESIEILKGATAAVLYGERGANGVIVVKTKP
jgi:TonB-dependent SusC/RagA subfamily outer membrane receptor